MKIYTAYPSNNLVKKGELLTWCHKAFGRETTSDGETYEWVVTSDYEGRPRGLNPFKFSTTIESQLTAFLLRWA